MTSATARIDRSIRPETELIGRNFSFQICNNTQFGLASTIRLFFTAAQLYDSLGDGVMQSGEIGNHGTLGHGDGCLDLFFHAYMGAVNDMCPTLQLASNKGLKVFGATTYRLHALQFQLLDHVGGL